jgi:hypothetical protein
MFPTKKSSTKLDKATRIIEKAGIDGIFSRKRKLRGAEKSYKQKKKNVKKAEKDDRKPAKNLRKEQEKA